MVTPNAASPKFVAKDALDPTSAVLTTTFVARISRTWVGTGVWA
jgi:hypothetical protein